MYDDLFNKLKKTNEFITKEQIYALYEQVLNEIKSGKQDAGVWAKAYADARGDLQVQKALYIELMVERYVLAGEAEQEAINLNKKKEKRKAFKEKMDKATESVKEFHSEASKPYTAKEYIVGFIALLLILPIMAIWYDFLDWNELSNRNVPILLILGMITSIGIAVVIVETFVSIRKSFFIKQNIKDKREFEKKVTKTKKKIGFLATVIGILLYVPFVIAWAFLLGYQSDSLLVIPLFLATFCSFAAAHFFEFLTKQSKD